MPLSAIFQGQEVLSVLCDDDQWENIREVARRSPDQLVMAYSGLPCLPRVSKNGVKHFYHRRGQAPDIDYRPETQYHILAKALVVQEASRLGWFARSEVASPDRTWIADVLLERQGVRIAVEVQWSRQSESDYRKRSERYFRSGIHRVVWLTRHSADPLAHDYYDNPKAPRFPIKANSKNGRMFACVNKERYDYVDLTLLINKLLSGRIQYVQNIGVKQIVCWNCRYVNTMWGSIRDESVFDPQNPYRSEPFYKVMQEYALRQGLAPAARVQMRYTKMSDTTYLAFVCRGCDLVQGDLPLRYQMFDGDEPMEVFVMGAPEPNEWADLDVDPVVQVT